MTSPPLSGKKIILAVTGSIAAYKTVDWLREMQRAGADLTVIMTTAGARFVTPLTFAALSGNKVYVDIFDPLEAETIPHISLAHTHDLILVAPATAQTIAKLANGLADDLLSTVVLAAKCPVLICPAMNPSMYTHPAFQKNLQKLKDYGYTLVEPGCGEMACGDHGTGRLADWPEVADRLLAALTPQDMKEQTILVTAGPTHEPLDPVRFISNRSTGKMGYALARMARIRGAKVTLVSGPSPLPPPPGVETIKVRTAQEMYDQVLSRFDQYSIIIKAAAVSDYRPQQCQANKIKKGASLETLSLTANPDILKALGAKKSKTGPLLVGFAAESFNHLAEGQRKLRHKNLDYIVINDIIGKDTGFGADTNKVTILAQDGGKEELPLLSKEATAMRILDRINKSMKNPTQF